MFSLSFCHLFCKLKKNTKKEIYCFDPKCVCILKAICFPLGFQGMIILPKDFKLLNILRAFSIWVSSNRRIFWNFVYVSRQIAQTILFTDRRQIICRQFVRSERKETLFNLEDFLQMFKDPLHES